MGVKRYTAPDGKYAWYDEEKHKLVDGKLVLLKQERVVSESTDVEDKPKGKKSKK